MNKAPYYNDISNAIMVHHRNYGKGDVKAVRVFADGRIEVDAKRTSCKAHTSRGRLIDGRTIRMYRHQLTVRLVGAH